MADQSQPQDDEVSNQTPMAIQCIRPDSPAGTAPISCTIVFETVSYRKYGEEPEDEDWEIEDNE